MNPKKKWVERHGCTTRNRRSRPARDLGGTAPHWFRNTLNRRVRRHDAALLHHGRWDEFDTRVVRDASWFW